MAFMLWNNKLVFIAAFVTGRSVHRRCGAGEKECGGRRHKVRKPKAEDRKKAENRTPKVPFLHRMPQRVLDYLEQISRMIPAITYGNR
jgi:hypothetical protein